MEVWLMDEVKRAIARYDAARRRYRAAVSAAWLSPFRSTVIRWTIRECQAAREDLRRLTSSTTVHEWGELVESTITRPARSAWSSPI